MNLFFSVQTLDYNVSFQNKKMLGLFSLIDKAVSYLFAKFEGFGWYIFESQNAHWKFRWKMYHFYITGFCTYWHSLYPPLHTPRVPIMPPVILDTVSPQIAYKFVQKKIFGPTIKSCYSEFTLYTIRRLTWIPRDFWRTWGFWKKKR